jgi:hypothetical protein
MDLSFISIDKPTSANILVNRFFDNDGWLSWLLLHFDWLLPFYISLVDLLDVLSRTSFGYGSLLVNIGPLGFGSHQAYERKE